MSPPATTTTTTTARARSATGTQAVFVKSKTVVRAGVPPLLMVLYFSAAVAFGGVLLATLLAVLLWGGFFVFTAAGAAASLAYAPGNVLLLWSTCKLGVGLATGIVSSARPSSDSARQRDTAFLLSPD